MAMVVNVDEEDEGDMTSPPRHTPWPKVTSRSDLITALENEAETSTGRRGRPMMSNGNRFEYLEVEHSKHQNSTVRVSKMWPRSCCCCWRRRNTDGEDGCCARICGGEEPGSLRALLIVFVLTLTFTGAQFFGAMLAHSLSMYADCITMALDCVTYLFNIWAEYQKTETGKYEMVTEQERAQCELQRNKVDVNVATFSAFTLIGVTVYILYDAILRLNSEVGVGQVNPQIMFGFTVVNLLMNTISWSAFACGHHSSSSSNKRRKNDHGDQEEGGVMDKEEGQFVNGHHRDRIVSRTSSLLSDGSFAEHEEKPVENLNVMSALVHLAADTLRSITVFITSLYVWETQGDSIRADAISSIIVCSLILLAAMFLIWETFRKLGDISTLEMSLQDRSPGLTASNHIAPI